MNVSVLDGKVQGRHFIGGGMSVNCLCLTVTKIHANHCVALNKTDPAIWFAWDLWRSFATTFCCRNPPPSFVGGFQMKSLGEADPPWKIPPFFEKLGLCFNGGRGYWKWVKRLGELCLQKNSGATLEKIAWKSTNSRRLSRGGVGAEGMVTKRANWRGPENKFKRSKIVFAGTSIVLSLGRLGMRLLWPPA